MSEKTFQVNQTIRIVGDDVISRCAYEDCERETVKRDTNLCSICGLYFCNGHILITEYGLMCVRDAETTGVKREEE